MADLCGARWASVLALVAAGMAIFATAVAGQENCEWLAPTSNFTSRTIGATSIITVDDPHLQCADGIRLRADSARHYENQDFYQLFGNALFEDPAQRIEGELIRYWRRDGRVEVRGSGRIERKDDGSVVTGDEIDLLQAGERRDRDQLTVTGGRPRVVFHPGGASQPADTAGSPWDVIADRLFFWGEESLTASGEVEMRRDSLEAFAESMEYDELNDRLSLRRDARMITDAYELEGDSILGLVVDGEVRNLRAMGRGVLVGEDVRLAAPRITIETPRGMVERLVAVRERTAPVGPPGLEEDEPEPRGRGLPPGGGAAGDTLSIFDVEHPERPVARAEDFLIVADSIEVQVPEEVLNRIIAVGSARAESTARDSLNTESTPEIARRDWIDGDTIVASFAQVEDRAGGPRVEPDAETAAFPADPEGGVVAGADPESAGVRADTARNEYRLEELLARVEARSLYRLAPADTAEARDPATGAPRLAVHYVTGTEIRITFADGEMNLLEVAGATEGVHIEPIGGSALPRDTADTAPDTSAAAGAETPDTASARAPSVGREDGLDDSGDRDDAGGAGVEPGLRAGPVGNPSRAPRLEHTPPGSTRPPSRIPLLPGRPGGGAS